VVILFERMTVCRHRKRRAGLDSAVTHGGSSVYHGWGKLKSGEDVGRLHLRQAPAGVLDGDVARVDSVGQNHSSLGGLECVLRRIASRLGGTGVLVEVHEPDKIELGLLEKLELADHAVVFEREDLAALLLDLLANVVLKPINQRINNFNYCEKTLQKLRADNCRD
jgi:hypothetical protein